MRWRQTVLLAVAVALSSGCAHDHRALVATTTLLNAQGAFDEAAYGAALRTKFPPGSPLEALRRYVRDANGECKERDAGQLWCEIPYRGGFCWAQLIDIDIQADASVVKDMKIRVGGLGC